MRKNAGNRKNRFSKIPTSSNVLNELQETFLRARPSKDDFDTMVKIAKRMELEDSKLLFDLLKERPLIINFLAESIQKKKALIKAVNLPEWSKIIKEEEIELTIEAERGQLS